VPPTITEYERLAAIRGTDGLVSALLARHNMRWDNVRRNAVALSDGVAETLHVVFPIDVFLWKSGVRFTDHPASPYGGRPPPMGNRQRVSGCADGFGV
jgi:hypothetical protein